MSAVAAFGLGVLFAFGVSTLIALAIGAAIHAGDHQ